ncbi:MAG: hypothetical protein J1E57_07580 [Prevotella sp.]|nr:hypothetical protein [Prevotella sp.]
MDSIFYEFMPIDETGRVNVSAYVSRMEMGNDIVWLPVVIGIGIFIMWFICKFVRRLHGSYWYSDNNLLRGYPRLMNTILVIATNLFIIFYVVSEGPAALWFLLPDVYDSWTPTVIGGIVYIYALISLLVGFLKTMDDYGAEDDERIDCFLGLFTLAIGLIAVFICMVAKQEYMKSVLIVLGVFQIVQLALIFKKALPGGVLNALVACVTYIVCSIGLILYAAPFVFLLLGLAAALFVLSFALKLWLSTDSRSYALSQDSVPVQEESASAEEYDVILKEEGRLGELKGKTQGDGKIKDEEGHYWRKDGSDGSFIKID